MCLSFEIRNRTLTPRLEIELIKKLGTGSNSTVLREREDYSPPPTPHWLASQNAE